MDRRELKMGAKEAMRVAAISPYGVTIVYGIIMFIISGVQKALDDWGMILFQTGEYEDLSQLSSYVLISLGFFIIYFLFSSILDFGYQLLCLKFSNRDSSMSYSDLFIGIRYLFKVLGYISNDVYFYRIVAFCVYCTRYYCNLPLLPGCIYIGRESGKRNSAVYQGE